MAEPGLRIIIVEDEPLIAMMMEDFLGLLGHRVMGTVEQVAAALDLVAAGDFDVAIVDVNLSGGEKCWPVAEALTKAGKPFILASGAGGDEIEAAYRDRPVLAKPFTLDSVGEAIEMLG